MRKPAISCLQPIAVIGLACRFPRANNPEAFWQLLCNSGDAITEFPTDRAEINKSSHNDLAGVGKVNGNRAAFLDQVDQFDPIFFGISPREAVQIDPQQRLMLELSWEALEDAGLPVLGLKRSETGVFFGAMWNDYRALTIRDVTLINQHTAIGQNLSIIANRVSYVFGFHGPSIVINTATSSSLVAVHLACESLWLGESTLALAGGVNLIISPDSTLAMSKLGVLSPDGCSKVFDARANGYVRGEGAGVIVLKLLSAALAANDPIYCAIRGTAVNNDGFSSGITVPNQEAQERLLRKSCESAGVIPRDVQYVEAHGTGTMLGDPIEARALGTVMSVGRPSDHPLIIGSVKTNIGHLEAAAGIAGLIKVALSIKHRAIPPSLHLEQLNPSIPFDRLRLKVQQVLGPWSDDNKPYLAGISSFGLGGTNCHVIVEEIRPSRAHPLSSSLVSLKNYLEPAELLVVSAHTPKALRDFSQAISTLATECDDISLSDLCYTASVRRTHHNHRLALVAHSKKELVEQLKAFVAGAIKPEMSVGQVKSHKQGLVFVYSGQGSQWCRMGNELFEQELVFRQKLEECEEAFRRHTDWSLIDEVMVEESRSRLDQTEIAQPAIFALQVALTALWRSWGIEPDAVVGHSVGEVAAAHVAGILSLEEAVQVVVHRGRLMQQLAGKGKMVAIEVPLEEAQQLIAGYQDRLSIAAINSPTSTVLSGDTTAVEEVLRIFQQRKIWSSLLRVNCAFHSHHMKEIQHGLVLALGELKPKPASIAIYSTVTGQLIEGRAFDAKYWVRNVLEPVRFRDAVESLINEDHKIFLEISPSPILSKNISQCLASHNPHGAVLPSLHCSRAERDTMLSTLGSLYTLGKSIKWRGLYRNGSKCVQLPIYPWQRKRYWIGVAEEPDSDALPNMNSGRGKKTTIRDALDGQPVGEWQSILEGYLQEWLAGILMVPVSMLDVNQSLVKMGIDSLMALEVKNRIEFGIGLSIPVIEIIEQSLSKLATQLAARLTLIMLGPSHVQENGIDRGSEWEILVV